MIKTASSKDAVKETEIVAVIVSAIVAMGYSEDQISLIRPVIKSGAWRLAGRMNGL